MGTQRVFEHHEALVPVNDWLLANSTWAPVKMLAKRGYGGTTGVCRYALDWAFRRFAGQWGPLPVESAGGVAPESYELAWALRDFAPLPPWFKQDLPLAAADYLHLTPGLARVVEDLELPAVLGLWAFGLELRATREEETRRGRHV